MGEPERYPHCRRIRASTMRTTRYRRRKRTSTCCRPRKLGQNPAMMLTRRSRDLRRARSAVRRERTFRSRALGNDDAS